MKSFIPYIINFGLLSSIILLVTSCDEDYLVEEPVDRFSPENVLIDKAGFEAVIVALHSAARREDNLDRPDQMGSGTDVSASGVNDGRFFNDYSLITPQEQIVVYYWDWAYTDMLKLANMVISRAENPEIEWTEEEKNQILAEARFFRGYTYNVLVNLFGGVPIIDEELSEPRFDFVRASRQEVLEFIEQDLEFAAQWLPVVGSGPDGRIYKAAAYHLLSEVYISLGLETGDDSYFNKSVEAASQVIEGKVGNYQLMTERFGNTQRPGDVYSDLFWTGQQNRSSGNLETIWAVQYEFLTPGGGEQDNTHLRWWGPQFERVLDPNGTNALLVNDSLGRSQGGNRPTNYFFYDIWKDDPDDMRNSEYNIRRTWYNNNPESDFFLQEYRIGIGEDGQAYAAFPDGSLSDVVVDTIRQFYPMIRKIEGLMLYGPQTGRTSNDRIRMRLAETYLLRAEAYLHMGNTVEAAEDINVVRARANATPVDPAEVDIDYILDERARELIVEEPRRRTLVRLGLLYERTKKYNYRAGDSIQPYHELWPIPQKAIDANRDVKLQQNPGYPAAE